MHSIEVRIKGKNTMVPAADVNGRTVIVVGKWLKVASIKDETFTEGNVIEEPERFITLLKQTGLRADVLTFSDKPPFTGPKHCYHCEWDNLAAIDTTDWDAWWERLPQETRKNVRRAQKRDVTVRVVDLDDELIRGIVAIYNECPIRQGKAFPHYGKDFDTVKREVSTFPENSEFLGAYVGSTLIGFIKLVYLGPMASILHIVSLTAHEDKRPTNALLAEAVAQCVRKKKTSLVYGNYTYGKKAESSLTEFKRRNGFDKVMFPTYYVPLTVKGTVTVALKLHLGLVGVLPPRLLATLLGLRYRVVVWTVAFRRWRGQWRAAARP
ncbi:MAG: hypothetical protein DMF89_02845 [Acidobacteria bacterium]|nr:MAG: hypothetical protein DMF89_02845 [Acidobacteriota bacterium]